MIPRGVSVIRQTEERGYARSVPEASSHATRNTTVRRPDRMSIDIEDRDGTRRGFRFDGKQIAFFDLDEKVYATAEKSGDLDTAFAYFTQDLQMPLPMGELFTNNLPTGLI
jgi:hypothetical protein